MYAVFKKQKLEEIGIGFIRSFWKKKEIGWNCIPVNAPTDGILVILREDRLKCRDVILGDYSISCLFYYCGGDLQWVFIEVYCKGTRVERGGLWRELEAFKNAWGGKWVVGGISIWC